MKYVLIILSVVSGVYFLLTLFIVYRSKKWDKEWDNRDEVRKEAFKIWFRR